MYPHLGHSFTNWLAVPKIAVFRPINARLNTPESLFVLEVAKPSIEYVRGEDRVHADDCNRWDTVLWSIVMFQT